MNEFLFSLSDDFALNEYWPDLSENDWWVSLSMTRTTFSVLANLDLNVVVHWFFYYHFAFGRPNADDLGGEQPAESAQ